jgi:hypothetical protein
VLPIVDAHHHLWDRPGWRYAKKMARQNVQVCTFNGGEVSKLALARVDVEKLHVAAACQLNWLPWAIGPMMLRPGLPYISARC